MEIKNTKFDFNDFLIVPEKTTDINSRYKDVVIDEKKLPLMTAPMDTVVGLENMKKFIDLGVMVVLPRTIKYCDYFDYLEKELRVRRYEIRNSIYKDVFLSLGFEDIENNLKCEFVCFPLYSNILIDVANGHMMKVLEYSKKIKEIRPDISIMVGNIANPETYRIYAESECVDYIRCGIGAGGGCLTTKQSGVGYPMASLVYEIKKIKDELGYGPKIVADGGMKEYSDIIKAIALGSDYVMVGSLFNKAIDSYGNNYFMGIKVSDKLALYLYKKKFTIKKYYRGMSTKDVQKAMGKKIIKTSEGVVRYRKAEYTLSGWVENFKHYLRSSMSYSDCRLLDEYKGGVKIAMITKNVYDRFNK